MITYNKMIGFLVDGKVRSLNEKYNELIDEYDNIDNMIKNHVNDNKVIEEYMNTKENIDVIKKEIADLFTDKNFGIIENIYCEFKGHCLICFNRPNDYKNSNYCSDDCSKCKIFRRLKEKDTTAEITKYYEEHINIKTKQLKEKPVKNTKIINIHNNLTINNITNNYIYTKDSFYYVTITSNENNAEDHLRYIFTYLMCGSSGKQLFPNEVKHSKAITFPVLAAKYNIHENEKCPKYTLYGVLRYEYKNSCTMTIKKLEDMGDKKFIVNAYTPNIGTHKTHILKDDIDLFINNVESSNNGSDIEKFYINNLK